MRFNETEQNLTYKTCDRGSDLTFVYWLWLLQYPIYTNKNFTDK